MVGRRAARSVLHRRVENATPPGLDAQSQRALAELGGRILQIGTDLPSETGLASGSLEPETVDVCEGDRLLDRWFTKTSWRSCARIVTSTRSSTRSRRPRFCGATAADERPLTNGGRPYAMRQDRLLGRCELSAIAVRRLMGLWSEHEKHHGLITDAGGVRGGYRGRVVRAATCQSKPHEAIPAQSSPTGVLRLPLPGAWLVPTLESELLPVARVIPAARAGSAQAGERRIRRHHTPARPPAPASSFGASGASVVGFGTAFPPTYSQDELERSLVSRGAPLTLRPKRRRGREGLACRSGPGRAKSRYAAVLHTL